MQLISAISEAADRHLPAVELFFAKNTRTPIIERRPGSKSIFRAQDRQSVVEADMNIHSAKAVCSLHRNKQSGRWMIV